MAIGRFLKSLIGGGSGDSRPKQGETIEYQGFSITPAPLPQNGQYLTAGTIRKDVDGKIKEQSFIRADICGSFDQACDFSVGKAKQIIDQQGERLFDQSRG